MDRRKFFWGAASLSATAFPASGAVDAPAFIMKSIALYLPQPAMIQRGPAVEVLAPYIQSLVARAKSVIEAQPSGPGVSGSIVVALKPPAQSRMWLVLGDKSRQASLSALLKGPLEGVPPPAVRGYNAFAINCDIWGGGSRPVSPIPVPDEWMAAIKGSAMLPDAPLKVLWPD